jgi:hypothetical protein
LRKFPLSEIDKPLIPAYYQDMLAHLFSTLFPHPALPPFVSFRFFLKRILPHPKRPWPVLFFILCPLSFILSSCSPLATPTALPISPTATPTSIPPLATLPLPTPAPLPTLPPAPTPTTASPVAVPPKVLPTAWDDRSPFKADLVPSAQGILSALPGASVYHIDITIAKDLASLTGNEEVLYTNRETAALGAIHFRLFPNILGGKLTVSQTWLNDQPVQPALDQQGSDLAIRLPTPLAPGKQAVLRMEFAVEVPTSQGDGYATFVLSRNILSLAQFYPLIPAYDAAGWHTEIPPAWGDVTYSDTSFYLVRITAPADLIIAATGAAVGELGTDSTQTLTYAAGPVRDFYIQASPDYILKTAKDGDVTLNTFVLPSGSSSAPGTLTFTRNAFTSFTRRFGPYPYTVFNVTASPTQALGVEYPQEVAIAVDLYDPHSTSFDFLEGVIVHEIAHQWWYGIVGDDQVNQPWLDEAMAQYATDLYILDEYGQGSAANYRKDWSRRWAQADSAPIPIGEPVSAYTGTTYSAIVYGRGPIFIDALAAQMGEADFSAFLKNYYQAYQYGIVTTADYEKAAETACSCDLSPLFKEWVNP